jgi:hypothetical protein
VSGYDGAISSSGLAAVQRPRGRWRRARSSRPCRRSGLRDGADANARYVVAFRKGLSETGTVEG